MLPWACLPGWRLRLLHRVLPRIWELYSDSFSGCPGSDKFQHRKWPLAHERPRVTQIFPSGVIHQKLRLERAQHAGYLLIGLRCVFMHLLMDPDIFWAGTGSDFGVQGQGYMVII